MSDKSHEMPRSLFVALTAAAALQPLNSTIISVVLPEISQAFAVDPGTLTAWVVTPYLIAGIALQSIAGRIADGWGYRRARVFGQVLFAFGTIAAVSIPHFLAVVVGRLAMAVGGAFLVPTAMAQVQTRSAPEQRVRAFGILDSVLNLAAAAGPFVGGFLAGAFGWRAAILANVPLLALAFALGRARPGDEVEATKPVKVDVLGVLLLAASLTCVVVGAKSKTGPNPTLLAIGAGLFLLFAGWQLRAKAPLVDLSLLRIPTYVGATFIIAFHYVGTYALTFGLPLVAAKLGTLSPTQVGTAFTVFWLAMTSGTAIGSRVAERVGVKAVIVAGSVVGMAAFVFLARAETLASFMPVAACLAAFGLAVGTSMLARANAFVAVPKPKMGLAGGMMKTIHSLAGLSAVTVVAVAFSNADAATLVSKHGLVCTVAVVSLALSIPCTLFLLPRRGAAARA